ncbi:MAG: diacylglycerol kinase family protein [Actinomycetota bacterium]
MTGPFVIATLLVDPGVQARIDDIVGTLGRLDLDHRIERLGTPDAAGGAARAALERGDRFLVAVGGDEIVHEVVNALFEQGVPEEPPILGVIAAGADNEFLRQFGLPLDAERACRHLAGDNVYPIDIGRAACAGHDGGTRTRYFANIAAAGLSATFAARADGYRSRRRLFLAFWRAVLTSKRAIVDVEAARKTYRGRAFDVVVGNGRFGPGGFRVSPRSFPGDGILEVLVHHGPRSHAFTSLPKAYRGEQVPSPHITELRGNRVSVEADPPLPVAVDGRPLGRTPARFDVLPQALLLKV